MRCLEKRVSIHNLDKMVYVVAKETIMGSIPLIDNHITTLRKLTDVIDKFYTTSVILNNFFNTDKFLPSTHYHLAVKDMSGKGVCVYQVFTLT